MRTILVSTVMMLGIMLAAPVQSEAQCDKSKAQAKAECDKDKAQAKAECDKDKAMAKAGSDAECSAENLTASAIQVDGKCSMCQKRIEKAANGV